MTVRELSERSGVYEDTITKIENGHRQGRSMTLRKLAKALGVRPHQLAPEVFERDAKSEILPQNELFDAEVESSGMPEFTAKIEAACERVSRALETVETVEESSGVGAKDYLKHLTEGQRGVLQALSQSDGASPPKVAHQMERDVNAVSRDVAILIELGLASRTKSGKYRATPLGEGAAEILVRGGLSYNEVLRHIPTLVKYYESALAYYDSLARPNDEEAEIEAQLLWLQEWVIKTIKDIVNAAKTAPDAQALRGQSSPMLDEDGERLHRQILRNLAQQSLNQTN